jgi:hypothetical protein
MKKLNREKLIIITASALVIPLIVWLRYSIGEPQAVWFVNLLFGLN